ncbi:hypothetical protein BHE74_00059408, partial [Ensete ventricosum]
ALALLHPHCATAVAAPTQVATALCDRQPPCQGAATPAAGTASPTSDRAVRDSNPLRVARWRLPLWAGRTRPCPWVAAPCRLLPPRAAAPCRGPCHSRSPLASSQAMADHPCRGLSRGQPPLYADNMHVAAPPPQAAPTFVANRCNKHVEQFYAIHSHHTQFKTNFSHENLALIPLLGNLSREIVYPCIPYPDGEDEGGQASSSLAVSTRWISTAKFLQSDLITLAQREGGE